jgi:transposase
MPKGHRHYAEWTPERLIRWAGETGEATSKLIAAILSRYSHPQQGFRSALGILALSKRFEKDRLEAACRRALVIGGISSRSVKSILETGLDRNPLPEQAPLPLNVAHDNIRGGKYYH